MDLKRPDRHTTGSDGKWSKTEGKWQKRCIGPLVLYQENQFVTLRLT